MSSKLKQLVLGKHHADVEPTSQSEKLASNNPYNTQNGMGQEQLPTYSANAGPSSAAQLEQAPPPYDPWLAVPDSTLLPPPPPMRQEYSPANNASPDEAVQAQQWCYYNPIWGPRTWSGPELSQIQHRQFTLSAPPRSGFLAIEHKGRGRSGLQSARRQGDITVLSNLPLFTAMHPLQAGEERTIYYQILIKQMAGPEATVAIGFLAPPYPPNRLPGWHRGSLAVHNDDGRRFVNDDQGGTDFVRSFGQGDRIGLGMRFVGSQYQGQPPTTRVFFTRDGREENSWDLNESVDIEAGGIMALDGTTDIYAAIGVCSGVDLEVIWDEPGQG